MTIYTVHIFEDFPKSKEEFEKRIDGLTDKYLMLSPCSAILAANESIKTVEKHFGGKATVLNQFSDSFKTSKGEDYENEIRDILSESPPTVVSID